MSRRRELALAATLDLVVGEPPAAWHPVVWMGRLADRLEARLPAPGERGELLSGGLAWGVGVATVGGAALIVRQAPWPVRGIALWTLFSGRMLVTEVVAVEGALRSSGTAAGRNRIARLVSRPTEQLSDAEVRMAAIETVAENLSDSWVAPLLWWRIGGLPAATVYRWVNTLDARWGYRDPTWLRRGRVVARADDAANLLPARATALALRGRLDAPLRQEAARTDSPNAGWPMAAMALALDVRLHKHDAYSLHPTGSDPDRCSVPTAVRRAAVAGLAVLALVWASAGTGPRARARRRQGWGRR